ncbi:hypothetical protein FRC12_015568, partial [Ceratobasidium sp. 428]
HILDSTKAARGADGPGVFIVLSANIHKSLPMNITADIQLEYERKTWILLKKCWDPDPLARPKALVVLQEVRIFDTHDA